MSEARDIHAHYDGKFIVLDEPVNLPINEPLIISVEKNQNFKDSKRIPVAEMTPEQRRAGLRKLVKMMANNPDIPIEATRRIHMYDDDRN